MRIVRFAVGDDIGYGFLHDDDVVERLSGHPCGEVSGTGLVAPLSAVRLLAPILPSKVIAVGRNYAEHARELGNEVPAEPMIFLKPTTSICGPGDPIVLPWQSEQVEHEAELAVVIRALCRSVPQESALDWVLGYTCANDVTARDLQRTDGQWGRAKGFDTFCPIGPWIETDLDPADLEVSCRVNGELRQSGRTSHMVFDVAHLVSWVSSVMTLLPGDIIVTGTPAGVGPLTKGDEVTVSIEGIGTLTNRVVDGG